jgi:predicted transglutaminase-like cysteine proteinase
MPIVQGIAGKSTPIEYYPVTSQSAITHRRPAVRRSLAPLPACPDRKVFAIPNHAGHPPRSAWGVFVTAAILCLLANALCAAGEFTLTREAIAKIQREYGELARERVVRWQELIKSSAALPDREKLQRANDFFNELEFVNDIDHWGKKDYWATPLETLVSNGGDCEDFAIAKYFTLREMGIPDEKMRLAYVKALRLNQAHMVLTYLPSPHEDPLVLDNLEKKISPAAARNDLLPVYSFNGNGLWLAKARLADGKEVGSADRLAPWRDVIARISNELAQ